jgi:hypothetical protein
VVVPVPVPNPVVLPVLYWFVLIWFVVSVPVPVLYRLFVGIWFVLLVPVLIAGFGLMPVPVPVQPIVGLMLVPVPVQPRFGKRIVMTPGNYFLREEPDLDLPLSMQDLVPVHGN